ncbi:MAG: lipopolysaccharide assembly protein LapA domain-containing protein [Patescibacteria group bacterium]
MFILFILGLGIGAITIIFALQNITPITVTFLAWQIDASLSLVLVLAALAGAIVASLLTIPGTIRNYFEFAGLKKRNRDLEVEVDKQKEARIHAAETSAPNTVYVEKETIVKEDK